MLGYWQRLMFNKKSLALTSPELVAPLWILSLYKKILSLVFKISLTCVALLILHRILRFLAFVTPLKVIMIVSSNRLPIFISRPLPGIELNDVVLCLAIFTILCFVGSIVLADLIEIFIVKASNVIDQRYAKVSNSIDIPGQIKYNFEQIAKSLAVVIFILFLFVVGTLLHPQTILLLALFIFSFWLCVFLSFKFQLPFKFESFLINRSKIQKWWILLSSLTIFAFILFTLQHGSFEDAHIRLLLVFLLSRYAIAAANEHISITFRIFNKIELINTLFFFNKLENTLTEKHFSQISLNSDFVHKYANILISTVIKQFDIHSIKPNVSSVYGVHCFDVYILNGDQSRNQRFIFKIFEPRYQFLANHEEFLLARNIPNLPAPKILNHKTIEGYKCILMTAHSNEPENYSEYSEVLVSVLSQMWSVPIENSAVQSYHRTHECDLERLNVSKLAILYLHVADPSILESLRFFDKNLEIIKDYCLNLPLSLDNSEINIKTVGKESDGNSGICYQWGRWSVQPIGCALFRSGEILNSDQINRILLSVKIHRKDCGRLTEDQLILCADLYQLLFHVEKQRYGEALKLISSIVSRFKSLTADD